jgi:serine/threonine protein kinase
MAKQTLTCSCGHSWEHTGSERLPADISSICPACSKSSDQTLVHEQTVHSHDRPDLPPLHPGEVLAGFEILEELNRGGMGVIYKARQQGLNRLVALKVISPERLGCPDAMRRFQREVQAAALLSHPHIVTVYHTDLEGPRPFLAMEYVPGIDLFHLAQQAGPLAVAAACDSVRQAAHGLQHAFEHGLVHRDIKPANLMVTPSPLATPPPGPARPGRIKILDMGLARVTAGGATAGGLTQTGEFLGTPDYISPEQAEDPRRADVRSDLYSLGCTLYFLLSGEVPFPSDNLVQKIRAQLTQPPPSVAERRKDVPAALDALVKRLMAREPADRFQTPEEFIDALDAFLRQPASPAAAPEAPDRLAQHPPSAVGGTRQVQAHPGGVRVLSLSADGQVLLSGGLDEALRVWGSERFRDLAAITDGVGPVEDASLAPGGKWAASCSLRLFPTDMVVQVWDLGGGHEVRRLKGSGHQMTCVAVAPDGRRLAAGSADKLVRIWSLEQPTSPPLVLKGHTDRVSRLTFIQGGDSLLSAGHDGMVRLWDSRTGASKGTVNAQVGKVNAVAFARTGKRIAVAGDILRVRQPDGSFTALRGHRGSVLSVAFSPDGSMLISGGSDGAVRQWRAEDGEEMRSLDGHPGGVLALTFHPGGSVFFSAGADGIIRRRSLGT